MQVSVIAPPHEQWPLPWYLRAMPHVGYWTAPGDPLSLQAPVLVASMNHTAVLDGVLGDRYVSEFFGLRPEVLLTLYIERELWERFLSRADGPLRTIGGPPWTCAADRVALGGPPGGAGAGCWNASVRCQPATLPAARRGPPTSSVDSKAGPRWPEGAIAQTHRASRPRCRRPVEGRRISSVDSGLARDGLRGHRANQP